MTTSATQTTAPDERDTLLAMIADQRGVFRRAVSGLTEEQARSIPSASSISLASLLKHVTQGQSSAASRFDGVASDDPVADWIDAWKVPDDATIDDLVADLNRAGDRYEAVIRREPDLNRIIELPADVSQWMPKDVVFTVRWMMLHQIEELARHAGHADIIRESIDGATADRLS